MPMLADIDDPPRSRARGMLIGLALAAPVAAVFIVWVIPALVQAVLGGAQSADDRLRMEDAYMRGVCTSAFDMERDEGLCECVLATDYPALDCQAAFLEWSVEQQQQYCAVEDQKKDALAFCSCVDAVAANMEKAADEDGRTKAATAYRNCQELEGAVYLPEVEELAERSSARAVAVE